MTRKKQQLAEFSAGVLLMCQLRKLVRPERDGMETSKTACMERILPNDFEPSG